MAQDHDIERLGQTIRDARTQANLTLRELAARASVSNPYLSQIERGLHEPSVRVLRSIAIALKIPAATLLAEAGLLDGDGARTGPATEIAIRADHDLTDDQRAALLDQYRQYRAVNQLSVG